MPTRARDPSTARCRRSSSSTARETTTASGRCSRAISRIMAGTCSPSTCRGTTGPAAKRCRRSRLSRNGSPRCRCGGDRQGRARRPFAGIAGGARVRSAAPRPRHQGCVAWPRVADAGFRCAARRRDAERSRRVRAHHGLVVQSRQATRGRPDARRLAHRQRAAAAGAHEARGARRRTSSAYLVTPPGSTARQGPLPGVVVPACATSWPPRKAP